MISIAWPISAEQSINSAHVSTGLGIAYELFEVRDGKALKVCRTGKTHSGTLEAIRAEAAATLDSAFGSGGVEGPLLGVFGAGVDGGGGVCGSGLVPGCPCPVWPAASAAPRSASPSAAPPADSARR